MPRFTTSLCHAKPLPGQVSCRFLVVDCGFESGSVRQCSVIQPAQLSWGRIKEMQESFGASGVLACGVAFTDITSSGKATSDVQEFFPGWKAVAEKNVMASPMGHFLEQ